MKNNNKTVLIIHGYSGYPLRSTVRDSLYSFKNYANAEVFYLNLNQYFEIPNYIKNTEFDLIIFHTTFMSYRWWGEQDFYDSKIYEKCSYFRDLNSIKAIMPQDEWINTVSLSHFVNKINIDFVFTVAPKSEWKKIYENVDFNKVQFRQILTGYIDDKLLIKINKLKEKGYEKNIDIGYRANKSPAWLGSYGYLKTRIADEFIEATQGISKVVDISTNPNDTFIGDGWYEFLLRCKYFIGVEGGSSIIDPDGEIWRNGTEYLQSNPNATFEEVERACFKGLDGNLNLIVISPRHLEACFTHTCQILIEGDYNGILKPNIHYIPLKRDFSNMDEVLEKLKDEQLRLRLVANTYRDIVESNKYTYRYQVDYILSECFGSNKYTERVKKSNVFYAKMINRISEFFKWKIYGGIHGGEGFWNWFYYSLRVRLLGYKEKMGIR